jgi:integrase/recombinase XerD
LTNKARQQAARPSLDDSIAAFVAHQAARISPTTAKNFYGYPLRALLLPFCQEQGIVSLDELSPEMADRFATSLYGRTTRHGKPISRHTVLAYLKATKHFLAWGQDQGLPVVSEQLRLPSSRRIRRDVLTPTEVDRLEQSARSDRDRLIIRLMAETGMREGEVANLRIQDLVAKEGRYFFLSVRGKTGQRMVPIRGALYRRLRAYMEGKTGRPRVRTERVFIAERRRPGGDYEPLTEDGIYRAIKYAVARSGIERRVYPHLLRHSAITDLAARRRLHPGLVSEITGVSVQVISQHYLHPTDEETWEAVMRALDS